MKNRGCSIRVLSLEIEIGPFEAFCWNISSSRYLLLLKVDCSVSIVCVRTEFFEETLQLILLNFQANQVFQWEWFQNFFLGLPSLKKKKKVCRTTYVRAYLVWELILSNSYQFRVCNCMQLFSFFSLQKNCCLRKLLHF